MTNDHRDLDHDHAAGHIDARYGHRRADALTPRLAALLVGSHTRPGDTVVSIGDDPALAGAAGAGGRRYRAVARTDQLADLDHAAGTVALIMLPCPPAERTDAMNADTLVGMFDAPPASESVAPGDIDGVPGNPPAPIAERGVADTSADAHPRPAHAGPVGNTQHGDQVGRQVRQDSQPNGESRYRPGPDQPGQTPPEGRIELRLAGGPDGKTPRARQAPAIRESMRWFATHRDHEHGGPWRPTRTGPADHLPVVVRAPFQRSFGRHRTDEPHQRAWHCGAVSKPFSSRTRRPDVLATQSGKRVLH